MASLTVPNNLVVQGQIVPQGGITLPSSCVSDAQVSAGASIDQSKLQHQHRAGVSQANGASATAQRQTVYIAQASTGATVLTFNAGCITAPTGADTCSVDLQRNGTSLLGAAISLTSSTPARTPVGGTISIANLSQNDTLEIVITPAHSTGTLPQGVFGEVRVAEAAS